MVLSSFGTYSMVNWDVASDGMGWDGIGKVVHDIDANKVWW